MFKTAGVRYMLRVFSALAIVSLVVLLGACVHPSTDTGEPKKWHVENVASKSTGELYADLIKPGVFESSSSKMINGYVVESGDVRVANQNVGSLVSVRSVDGSLTALINQSGMRGLLHINRVGESTFNPEPVVDSGFDDTIVNLNEKVDAAPVEGKAGVKVIDAFIGYSQAAVEAVGGDATANALAQVESVNLALRNSLVSDVTMRLVGTQIVPIDYRMEAYTLERITTIFASGVKAFQPDMIYGVFVYKGEPAAGIGQVSGRTAIGNQYSPTTYAHEKGHNAGSNHCNDGGNAYHQYGYFNGKSGSLLCGANRQLYYSNPDVKDEHGLPRGNAVTADTARVWRDNASRLSSYAPSFDGERMVLSSIGDYASASVTIVREPTSDRMHGVLANHEDEGPVSFEPAGLPPFTFLTATLLDTSGKPHQVKLRGSKSVGTCQVSALNFAQGCADGNWSMPIKIEYLKSDNLTLPKGIYTGEIGLRASSLFLSWTRPIRVAVSISRD